MIEGFADDRRPCGPPHPLCRRVVGNASREEERKNAPIWRERTQPVSSRREEPVWPAGERLCVASGPHTSPG